MREGARTICFIKSRKAVELVARIVRDDCWAPELEDRVAPYRAGYTPAAAARARGAPDQRRALAVITTDALELGIDIGALDAAVCVTFPGTVASLRQMWGRAGRRGRGLAVYVAGEDALDQFFCRHPDEFLERPVEAAIVWHENEPIHLAHLLCAAHEGPLDARRRRDPRPALAGLRRPARLAGRARRAPRPVPAAPSRGLPGRARVAALGLARQRRRRRRLQRRAAGHGRVRRARANTIHDGAVYLHLGRSYEVARARPRRAAARSSTPFDGNWYTQPKRETDMEIERLLDRREALGVTLSFGRVTVTEQVHAYQRKRLPDHEVIDLRAVDLPPHSFTTQALWYELGDDLLDEFPHELLLGALHAAEHTQIAVLPLLAMCDRWDIGGLSTNFHPQTGGPTIFIYDGHPGGVGITLQGFRNFDVLVEDAHRLIGECPCESGCPSCVQSPKCGNLNEPLSKAGALEVMARMLQR